MQRSIDRANFMKHSNAVIARKNRTAADRTRRIHRVACEALEERQLMSLTITLREADGSSSAVATSVGQVINLELLATVTSTNGIATQDALESANGKIESSAAEGHAIAGNLADTLLAPFTRFPGSDAGTFQDLNGDGNIDIGGDTPNSTAGDFSALAAEPEQSSAGTVIDNGTALQFELATVTYTVTSLSEGGTTNINYFPNVSTLPETASWYEEFNDVSNVTGTYQAGTPFTVSSPSLVVAPVAVNDTASIYRNTPTSVNILANDDIVVALNTSSVAITSAPAHGTAIPQTDGTVLYTPATGYTGTDTFSYTVADTGGRVSNVAAVALTIIPPPPPTAGAVASTTTRDQSDTITVLSADATTAPATLIASSVTVTTAPAHGTAIPETDGTIQYTPATGYIGSDTFQYTVSDTNGETSSPATVTLTVNSPTPPVAVADSATTSEGAPVSIDVLANDSTPQGTLNVASVVVLVAPTNGTAAVNTSDGSILYTPAPGYVGTDSFQYAVYDSLGDVSNTAAVGVTISAGVAPVANTVTAPALSGSTTAINVLSSATSGAPLVAASVAVTTQPTHGTATVNTSDGSIAYIPTAGFVGTDSFTYTVENVNSLVSAPATVNVAVGTTISSTRGAAHSLSFVDDAGGTETITLNAGSAELFFSGDNGSVSVSKALKATVTGSSLAINSIQLTGTTRSSTLSIRGNAKTPVTVGGITDAAPLAGISAASVILSGTVNLDSAGSLITGSISDAVITIGAAAPARLSITTGAVSDTSLTSSVPITSLRAASWTGAGDSIVAPSISSLIIAGGFDPVVTLSTNGRAAALTSARIGGAVDGTWEILGGITTAAFGSVASTWTGTIGKIASMTIKAGGLPSTLNAGAITTLSIAGDLTGTLTATSARVIRITGGITGTGTSENLVVNGALGQLIVGGVISGTTVDTAGSITALTANSITGSTIATTGASIPEFSAITAGTPTDQLGTNTIGSIRLTGRSGDQFTSSDILSDKITSASLGNVNTSNGSISFGIAVGTINSFAGTFSGNAVRANKSELANETVLAAFLNQQGVTFSDFEIVLAG